MALHVMLTSTFAKCYPSVINCFTSRGERCRGLDRRAKNGELVFIVEPVAEHQRILPRHRERRCALSRAAKPEFATARHDRGTHFVTAQHLSQPFPSIAFGAMPVQPILGTACHSGLASRSA